MSGLYVCNFRPHCYPFLKTYVTSASFRFSGTLFSCIDRLKMLVSACSFCSSGSFNNLWDRLLHPVDLFVSSLFRYFCTSCTHIVPISRGVNPLGRIGPSGTDSWVRNEVHVQVSGHASTVQGSHIALGCQGTNIRFYLLSWSHVCELLLLVGLGFASCSFFIVALLFRMRFRQALRLWWYRPRLQPCRLLYNQIIISLLDLYFPFDFNGHPWWSTVPFALVDFMGAGILYF